MRSPGKRRAQIRKVLCCPPPRDSPSLALSHPNFCTVCSALLGKDGTKGQCEIENVGKTHGKCKNNRSNPSFICQGKNDSKMIVWRSKKECELIWLHLLNVMLLLIRADKLGKENDNLALLVKEKMWRICRSTTVFVEAGQSWTFMDDCMIG